MIIVHVIYTEDLTHMDLVMLITVAGLLCQVECLTGRSRTSHQHKSNPSLPPTWPPTESPGSSSVVDLGPSAFPFSPNYVPSEGPSELFPFMAPSPLVVPVVSSPPPSMLTGILLLVILWIWTFSSLLRRFLLTGCKNLFLCFTWRTGPIPFHNILEL